jgi:ferritin-like metal-binding protein YciE
VSSYEQKIVQYLEEAHATEVALIRVLQSQIAMTPRGSTRTAIEEHLEETRGHADRVRERIGVLQTEARGANPLQAWVGLTEAVVGQALALGKAPLDMMRGTSGEEKVLKNAKDDCATEALEIATYTAIHRLAEAHGDRETAALAEAILADEQRMLDRLLGEEIPKLTDAVARAEIEGSPSFDPTTTGAADAVREAAGAAAKTTRRASGRGGRSRSASGASGTRSRSASSGSGSGSSARAASSGSGTRSRSASSGSGTRSRSASSGSGSGSGSRSGSRSGSASSSSGSGSGTGTGSRSRSAANGSRSGGSSRSGGTGSGRTAAAAEAPIAGYDDLNAADLAQRLSGLSQEQLAAVATYERAHGARATLLERVDALTEDEPWAGYDGQDVDEVRAGLRDADEAAVRRVRDYERRHKDRAGVIEATERAAATS